MATANRIELFNAAPVDMSNDAFSSAPLGEDPAPLGEDPATSGVQRLVVPVADARELDATHSVPLRTVP
jgi:hypothetical protein